jgi:hypothetical protein
MLGQRPLTLRLNRPHRRRNLGGVVWHRRSGTARSKEVSKDLRNVRAAIPFAEQGCERQIAAEEL